MYLDMAATMPVRTEVLQAIGPLLAEPLGNPSSRHSAGDRARGILDQARATVASVVGARPNDVVFTSGGTEADHLGVAGMALARPRGRRVLVSAVEHPAVLEAAEQLAERHGFTVTILPVDRVGRVRLDVLAAELGPEVAVCSIMAANNEVGTVQPLAEIGRLCADAGVPWHCDAVQAAGRLDLGAEALPAAALSISGHKLGGLVGTGALIVRRGTRLSPMLPGGGHQDGRRSGTENVVGAVALATALVLAENERRRELAGAQPPLAARRDAFLAALLAAVPGAELTGDPVERLPGHLSLIVPGINGETMLLDLDRAGISCSSGSACAAGSQEPSAVLTAMGVPAERAHTALRLSFGSELDEAGMHRVADTLGEIVRRLRD